MTNCFFGQKWVIFNNLEILKFVNVNTSRDSAQALVKQMGGGQIGNTFIFTQTTQLLPTKKDFNYILKSIFIIGREII